MAHSNIIAPYTHIIAHTHYYYYRLSFCVILMLCLSLSSHLHLLVGVTKGKHSCEPQEAHGFHSYIAAHQNHCIHKTPANHFLFASLLYTLVICNRPMALDSCLPLCHQEKTFGLSMKNVKMNAKRWVMRSISFSFMTLVFLSFHVFKMVLGQAWGNCTKYSCGWLKERLWCFSPPTLSKILHVQGWENKRGEKQTVSLFCSTQLPAGFIMSLINMGYLNILLNKFGDFALCSIQSHDSVWLEANKQTMNKKGSILWPKNIQFFV